jgi:hypothetical protein
MRRVVAGVAALLVVAALLAVAPAAVGHSNHVEADPQVVADDRVVVESLFSSQASGHLVVHADDQGRPGRPLGSVPVEDGFQTDRSVPVEAGAVGGPTDLWVVLHADDGDGEFDPADDDPLQSFGSVAGDQFRVRPAEQSTAVLARGDRAQASQGSVTVRRVHLGQAGHLVLQANDAGVPGGVVASRSLSAGVHRNVTLEVNESFFESADRSFRLFAVAYADDGDGEFDRADEAVLVDGDPVATTFAVRKGEPRDGPVVVTATSTAERASGGDGEDGGGLPLAGAGVGGVAALAALVAVATLGVARRRE